MPTGFADDAARAAFREAIKTIEGGSAAEVVIAVRRHAAPWTHAHLAAGVIVAIAAHAYMILAAHPFSDLSLLVDPIVVGVLAALASTQVMAVERWLTPPGMRRRAVLAAARATFVERGVRRTTGGTGILLFISIVERHAELVADDGVMAAVDPAEWKAACAKVQAAVARGGVATAWALADLAPLLSKALPRDKDDVNELPDDLDVHEARP